MVNRLTPRPSYGILRIRELKNKEERFVRSKETPEEGFFYEKDMMMSIDAIMISSFVNKYPTALEATVN